LQSNGKTSALINNNLRSLTLYYSCLALPNIAYNLRLRGVTHASRPLLSAADLDQLYHRFTPKPQGSYRHTDQLFLGLVIYQALDEQDLLRINYEDLNLRNGTLYIPGGVKRKAGRQLSLEAHQIIPFQHYLTTHRKETSDLLFYPQCETFSRLHDQFKSLAKQVKTLSAALGIHFICFNQLRQSRFTLWIQTYGLRKAQYLAGFKHVSSMESYRQQDTFDLIKDIQQYHPLQ
jgi:integrase